MQTMEENMRRIKMLYVMILMIASVTACSDGGKEQIPLEAVEIQEQDEVTEKTDSIFVYVCGAVAYEGIYELPAGCRVYEAIAKAGGFREDAATTAINQAEVLKDAMRLYVPTTEEAEVTEFEENGKVNINRATKEELMTLPGVGASRADSIIQYRKEKGAFQSIEDIMQISGIKEGLFEKIREYITV